MKLSALSDGDRERVATLIKELSRTCQQLDDLQHELSVTKEEKDQLSGKVEELEDERIKFKKCINAMEHEKLTSVKEYEVNVKDLHAKIQDERDKKERAKTTLAKCQKELGQLAGWNKKLQSDFIELQQVTIKATAPPPEKPSPTPQILEIPKLESIEAALKDIKTQIFECASLYANSRPPSCLTSARSPPPHHLSPEHPPSIAKLDLETSNILDDLNSEHDPLDSYRKSKSRKPGKVTETSIKSTPKSHIASTQATLADLADFEDLFFLRK